MKWIEVILGPYFLACRTLEFPRSVDAYYPGVISKLVDITTTGGAPQIGIDVDPARDLLTGDQIPQFFIGALGPRVCLGENLIEFGFRPVVGLDIVSGRRNLLPRVE